MADRRSGGAGHAPALQPVWLAATVAVLLSCALLAGVWVWLNVYLVPPAGASTTPANRALEVGKLAVALAGFVGVVLTGVYAYRKQRLAEGDARRADAEQFTVRFGRASEQLGHSNPAVRLAGVYALAALADDWERQRQTCVDVLTAYLRLPFELGTGEDEVRLTVLRVIRDHLRPGFSDVSWTGLNFRFEGAVFHGGDLAGAHFTGGNVSFHKARFVGGVVHFDAVRFSGARVWFDHARFEGGEVSFRDSVVTAGLLSFDGVALAGGSVSFDGVRVEGGEIIAGPFPALTRG